MLRRNAACLESLLRFERAAEPADDAGRRRLWVDYRRGGRAGDGRGRHYALGGYWEQRGDEWEWRTISLQGCPREVRLLLAGELYYDVDLVNSLPTVAAQLDALRMASAANLTAIAEYVADRQTTFDDLIGRHLIVGVPALGIEARDVAKARAS